MKLSSREAAGYLRRPDPGHTGLLIFGADSTRVALKRQDAVRGVLGDTPDMGLTRISAADLRKTPSLAADALKEQSMFSDGQRVVLVDGATDSSTGAISAALNDWSPGDAYLIVTAGALAARSKLRKAFESHANAYALGVYDDPPGRDEIEAMLRDEGLGPLDREAQGALQALAQDLPPSDFRQTVTKLALYKRGDDTPVSPAEIELMAPVTRDGDLDELIHKVAEARLKDLAPLLRRLEAQGTQPVTIAIMATRHFRTLHAAASDPGGVESGLSRTRPPVFGPRRSRMARQAQGWGLRKLEQALSVLTDTDLTLRSASNAPPMAVMERALIRLAMMARR